MKLKSLEIRDFKSISHIILDNLPEVGTILITGSNLDAGGSIGSGKTSLCEAVSFLLFGKVYGISKVKSLVRFGSDDLTLKGKIILFDGNELEIERTSKTINVSGFPSELTKTQVDNLLADKLGFDFREFITCCFMGADWESLLEMSPSERTSLFLKLFNLNAVDRIATKIRDFYKKKDAQLRKVEVAMAEVSGQLKQLKDDLTDKIVAFENERRVRLKLLDEEKKKIEMEIDKLFAEHEKLQAKERSIDKQKIEKELKSLKLKLKQLEARYSQKLSLIANITAELKFVKEKLIELDKVKTKLTSSRKCPMCRRKIDDKQRREILSDFDSEINKLKEYIKTNSDKLIKLSEEQQQIESEKNQIEVMLEKLSRYESMLYDIMVKKQKILSKIDKLKEDIERIKKRYAEIQAEVNPYQQLEDERKDKIAVLTDKLVSFGKQAEKLEKEMTVSGFWIDNMKKVKNYALHDIALIYANKINEQLREFDVDFTTFVEIEGEKLYFFFSRHNHILDFGNLSSGEKQTVRLASFFALNDLLTSLYNKRFTVFFFDEPLRNLDEHRKNLVFEKIQQYANFAQVFIIDHSPEFTSRFDHRIELVKQNGITQLKD